MARKKKQSLTEDTSLIIVPENFRDATNLSNSELNTLLKKFNLPTRGKKNHKVTTLCEYLNIQTAGTEAEVDPFLQTLADIKNLENGWSTDIRQMPDIRLNRILEYLLASHDITVKNRTHGDFEIYDENTLKSYKALRSYDLWECGHIHSVRYNELKDVPDFCALKCSANPSGDTSGTQYTVIVVLKETGEPVGASCSCIAGQGEACTHVSGLMFAAEEFVSRGYKNLPDQQATTEKLCKWIVPKGPSVTPAPIKNVSVKKRTLPKQTKKQKVFRASEYQPVVESKRDVNYDDLVTLRHTLSLSQPQIPWIKAVAPAMTEKYRPDRNTVQRDIPVAPAQLPELAREHDPVIVPAAVVETKTTTEPMTIKEKVKFYSQASSNKENSQELLKDFVDNLKYSNEERDHISDMTVQQSKSAAWYKYRKGIITASNFHRVCGRVNSLKSKGGSSKSDEATDKLVDELVNGSKFHGSAATRYGQNKEKRAADIYSKEFSQTHSGVNISLTGLHLHKEHCYLGASPDRISSCLCHGKRLVEIKSPHRLQSASDLSVLEYLGVDSDGKYYLKEKSNYYTQVQGQMAILGLNLCDFVIYVGETDTIYIIPVQFNSSFWENCCKKLCQFFQSYVAPTLLAINVHANEKNNNTSSNQGMRSTSDILQESRKYVQQTVSDLTKRFPCGKCGHLMRENVKHDDEACIGCDCTHCGCELLF